MILPQLIIQLHVSSKAVEATSLPSSLSTEPHISSHRPLSAAMCYRTSHLIFISDVLSDLTSHLTTISCFFSSLDLPALDQVRNPLENIGNLGKPFHNHYHYGYHHHDCWYERMELNLSHHHHHHHHHPHHHHHHYHCCYKSMELNLAHHPKTNFWPSFKKHLESS